jgi:hypothetical protein
MTKSRLESQKVKSFSQQTEPNIHKEVQDSGVFTNGAKVGNYVNLIHTESTKPSFNSIFEIRYETKSLIPILPPKGIQYLTICSIFEGGGVQIIYLEEPLVSFYAKLIEGTSQFDFSFCVAKPDILIINLKNEEIRLVVNENSHSSYTVSPYKAKNSLQDIPYS